MNTKKNESKDIKEITLYNFATIRNAEYLNHEALNKNINYITYNPSDYCDEDKIYSDFIESQIDSHFLDFDKLKQIKTPINGKIVKYDKGVELLLISEEKDKAIQVKLNNLFYRITNLYNSKIDNFHKINCLLEGLDFENKIKIELTNEKAFIKKIWQNFVYNIKVKNDFKEKEIATNLLRYFHLRSYQYLIDDEGKKDRWDNLSKLMNAQIIIPEELFPKHETLFYGKTHNLKSKYKPTEYIRRRHFLKVLQLRKSEDDGQNQVFTSEIDSSIKENEENLYFSERAYKKQDKFSTNLSDFIYLPYIATIEFINSKCYFLVSIDYSKFNKKDFELEEVYIKIKGKEFLFSKETRNNSVVAAGFDIYFELKDDSGKQLIEKTTEEIAENINFDFEVDFKLKDFVSIKSQLTWLKNYERYECDSCLVLDDGTDEYGKAFEPSGYGIQMLGIADYQKVVSTISRYIPAEVARIENLMSGEFREKVTTQETSTEITQFESSETDKENTNETSTNDRFQMQNEVAQILNEQRNNNLTATAGYSGGGYYANLTTGNAASTSKEQSNKQSITQAKEITNKAVEKIVSKIKKERTVKVTEKYIDVNKYGFDNRGNKEHVSGVYRHINAVYRNRIQNYGKRLTYEFSIPEPALIHKKGFEMQEDDDLIEKINDVKKPTNPFDYIKSYKDINQNNIEAFINEFEMEKPKKFIEQFTFRKGQAISGIGRIAFFQKSEIPENLFRLSNGEDQKLIDYIPINWNINGWVEYKGSKEGSVFLYIDEQKFQFNPNSGGGPEKVTLRVENGKFTTGNTFTEIELQRPTESASIYDFDITFQLKTELIEKWQQEQYNSLIEVYKKLKTKYEESIKKIIDDHSRKKIEDKIALIEAARNNPRSAARNRQIEIITLKRNCLSYLIDETSKDNKHRKFGTKLILNRKFNDFKIDLSPKLDEYTAFVRFLEQAFEWENMSYSFYPYFWGDNKDDSWIKNYNEDNDDPLHKAFLQAGMARVIVTVRPGFEDAVNLYMTTGKIWMGGNVPVYGSSLFVSIADELKNGNEEFFIEGEWETVLPTNLIAIQSSGVSIKQEGLPDLDEYGGLGKIDDRKALPKRKKFLGLF